MSIVRSIVGEEDQFTALQLQALLALITPILLPASEAIPVNSLVNIWNDAGTAKARRADAALGYVAHGYTAAAVAAAATATVKTSGVITGLTGRTPATRQYLGALGALTETKPVASGTTLQPVGIALSATTALYRYVEPVIVS